jgi:hypothetical protein
MWIASVTALHGAPVPCRRSILSEGAVRWAVNAIATTMLIHIAPLIQFTETAAMGLGRGVDAVQPLEAYFYLRS